MSARVGGAAGAPAPGWPVGHSFDAVVMPRPSPPPGEERTSTGAGMSDESQTGRGVMGTQASDEVSTRKRLTYRGPQRRVTLMV